ncbi:MAG TPA: NrfD/PsrC family molybdoenzyme membrane anchor subunit, partial [Polyangiaceae bacterium]|nr:NrfD/PsrC family molybdoenzyme membrane anchor subunit [Polyangiaceae bacterium]
MGRAERYAKRQRRDEVRGRVVGTRDGRNVSPDLGALVGEASTMRAARPDEVYPLPDERAPADPAATPTYYGLPLLKKPVWKGAIPAYFWAGGAAGAAATLGAAAQIVAPRPLRRLVERARWVATAGVGVGAGLLVVDLGRPARFIYMLRVLRLSSPMSVGSWILTSAGLSSGLAALG